MNQRVFVSYNSQELQSNSASLEKLASFYKLNHGWMFGRGVPTNHSVYTRAKSVILFLENNGWSTDVFPGESGEVLISLSRLEDDFEIILELDGTATLIQELEGRDIERWGGISDNEALDILLFPRSSWFTSDYSIHRIGSAKRTDLTGWHSETAQRRRQVSPLLIRGAQKGTQDLYVNISPDTTIHAGTPQLPVGYSSVDCYHNIILRTPHHTAVMSDATTKSAESPTKMLMRFSKRISAKTTTPITEFAEA